ncbi:MAG: 50S ribosomal protein L34e [Candidatus Woesearchaeota archaeon]|nr:MAG: 50S ribosomal protein L34e [Candidatus Woesearchaeota archaeon]
MVRKSLRSRSRRRVYKRLPGGSVKIHYEKRKPSRAVCGNCGVTLKGIPNLRPNKMIHLAKTKKRPERYFGGVLCSSCSREKIKEFYRKVQ